MDYVSFSSLALRQLHPQFTSMIHLQHTRLKKERVECSTFSLPTFSTNDCTQVTSTALSCDLFLWFTLLSPPLSLSLSFSASFESHLTHSLTRSFFVFSPQSCSRSNDRITVESAEERSKKRAREVTHCLKKNNLHESARAES